MSKIVSPGFRFSVGQGQNRTDSPKSQPEQKFEKFILEELSSVTRIITSGELVLPYTSSIIRTRISKKYRIYNLTDNLLFPMIRFVNIGLPLLHTGVSAEIFQPA